MKRIVCLFKGHTWYRGYPNLEEAEKIGRAVPEGVMCDYCKWRDWDKVLYLTSLWDVQN